MEKKERKKFWLTGLAVFSGLLLFCSGVTVGAATNEPGGAGDPLITRSYLEAQLKDFSVGYQCIVLERGEVLELTQGSSIILYTGNASVTGNLIDTTTGTLTGAKSAVERYHTYLAPADKSGFTADATCVIFLSGEKY